MTTEQFLAEVTEMTTEMAITEIVEATTAIAAWVDAQNSSDYTVDRLAFSEALEGDARAMVEMVIGTGLIESAAAAISAMWSCIATGAYLKD